MRVKDLVYNGKGVFYYMNEFRELEFLKFMEVDVMDILFNSLHGQRQVSGFVLNIIGDEVTESGMKLLGKVLVSMYGESWKNSFNIIVSELPVDSYGLTKTILIDDEGVIDNESNRVDSNTTDDKVSGYNTDDYVNNELTDISSQEKVDNKTSSKNKKKVVEEVSGTVGNVYDDRNKAIQYLSNNLIYDIIFNDVGRMLGLLIY